MHRLAICTQSCLLLFAVASLPGQAAPVREPAVPPRSVAAAPAAPALPPAGLLQFGFACDGEQVLVEVDGEQWQVTADGKKLPEQRARRTGSRIQVLDREGLLAAQVTLFGTGGTVQRFPDRQRVALGVRLGVPEPDSARLVGFEPAQVRRILSVTPGQPAAKAGLQAGDLLIEVEGKRPVNESRLRSVLQKKRPGELLPLAVSRAGQTLQLAVRLEPLAMFMEREAAELVSKTVPLPPAAPSTPLVHLDGNRMLVMEEAPEAPRTRVAARAGQPAPAPSGADPIVELKRVQERLEAMERLLQRVLEMREKTEGERTEAGKPGAARRDDE
jgi:hypothetical protein